MKLYDNDEYRDAFMALVYSLLSSDGTNDRANLIIDAFDRAPAVEAEPLLPEGPLTLEELRGMDGEPVWVKCLEPGMGHLGCWGIRNSNFVDGYHTNYCDTDYGKGWLAYRRRPEEARK